MALLFSLYENVYCLVNSSFFRFFMLLMLNFLQIFIYAQKNNNRPIAIAIFK